MPCVQRTWLSSDTLTATRHSENSGELIKLVRGTSSVGQKDCWLFPRVKNRFLGSKDDAEGSPCSSAIYNQWNGITFRCLSNEALARFDFNVVHSRRGIVSCSADGPKKKQGTEKCSRVQSRGQGLNIIWAPETIGERIVLVLPWIWEKLCQPDPSVRIRNKCKPFSSGAGGIFCV